MLQIIMENIMAHRNRIILILVNQYFNKKKKKIETIYN